MYKNIIKRMFDIMASLLVLPLIIIVIIICAPLIFLTDFGPIFYNAPRIGKDKKIFNMYKLRSMKMDAPDIRNIDGSTYNSMNDPRVTKVGKVIRKLSIDELPQFLNVLKGDMSIIGPRPATLVILENLSELQNVRFSVRPGITGYTQMKYRNSAQGDMRYKADKYYVENLSFILDLKILGGTILRVLSQSNIYNINTKEK